MSFTLLSSFSKIVTIPITVSGRSRIRMKKRRGTPDKVVVGTSTDQKGEEDLLNFKFYLNLQQENTIAYYCI